MSPQSAAKLRSSFSFSFFFFFFFFFFRLFGLHFLIRSGLKSALINKHFEKSFVTDYLLRTDLQSHSYVDLRKKTQKHEPTLLGFEPAIPIFEMSELERIFDRTATATGSLYLLSCKLPQNWD